MKTAVKVWIAVASVLTAVIVVVVIGINFGDAENGNHHNFSIFNNNLTYGTQTIKSDKDLNDVKSINMDIDCATVYVETDNEFSVEAENVDSNFYNVDIDNNKKLTIKCKNGSNGSVNFGIDGLNSANSKEKIPVITLKVKPEMLDLFELELAVCDVTIDNLKADKLDVDSDVGSIDLTDVEFNNVVFTTDVSKVDFEGKINSDCEFQTDVGKINITLDGDEKDFNYDVSSDVGKISLNDNTISGFDSQKKIDNNANKTLKANADTGKISINTNN